MLLPVRASQLQAKGPEDAPALSLSSSPLSPSPSLCVPDGDFADSLQEYASLDSPHVPEVSV